MIRLVDDTTQTVDGPPANLQIALGDLSPTGLAAMCAQASGPESLVALVDRREAADDELAGLALNPRLADLDRKAALLRLVYRHLASSEDYKLPGVAERLERIAESADRLPYTALVAQIKLLFKTMAVLKGRRHSLTQSTNSGELQPIPSAAGAEVLREEETQMPILLQVKDIRPIPEGQHNAKIRAIEEKESKFSDARHESYLSVSFELADGVNAGRTLVKGYSPSLSGKSNLGKLWKRLKGDLPIGKTLDVEKLIGEHVQIVVSHDMGDDGEVHERISEVFKQLVSNAPKRELAGAVSPER